MSIYTEETTLEVLAEMRYYGKQINEPTLERERPQLILAIKDYFGTLEYALSKVKPIEVKKSSDQETNINTRRRIRNYYGVRLNS
ncbi:hypothetical protein [Bacillus toyonensis]|uniref:hypothetical protein n=1 Tax=Bacillus toyonensis TaxID=155322 RepID=UPI000BF8C252|nr:hypothetical protein [Bacillus toyonensis]PGF00875.1 hypothetical protein COM61_22735 [Bacillus toyonensis]PHE47031.1 hypothetical protein COF71_13830 [Bacillus toyonensis]